MRQLTREWIEKAEGDQQVAESQWSGTRPVYDAVCFHSQQCVEKYLKAWLVEQQIPFPGTHDLELLAHLSLPLFSELLPVMNDVRFLTAFAVEIRYPGTDASKQDAERCLLIARDLRDRVRQKLGL